jgi:hypothetical protein
MIELTCVQGSLDPEALSQSWAFHVWTLIHEVPEGNWGGGGKVIYYADVKGLTTDGAWAAS